MGPRIMGDANSNVSHNHAANKILWTHADPSTTRMAEFIRVVNEKYSLQLHDYEDLYQWSITDVDAFWGQVWDFCGVTAGKGYDEVCNTISQLSRDTRTKCGRNGYFMDSKMSAIGFEETKVWRVLWISTVMSEIISQMFAPIRRLLPLLGILRPLVIRTSPIPFFQSITLLDSID
jgi:hypothetical protein